MLFVKLVLMGENPNRVIVHRETCAGTNTPCSRKKGMVKTPTVDYSSPRERAKACILRDSPPSDVQTGHWEEINTRIFPASFEIRKESGRKE